MPAAPAAAQPPLLHQLRDKCIKSHHRRSAYAFELNLAGMVEKYGLARCFEFTITTPDNCTENTQFQKRWHSLYTNILRKLFAAGCAVRERQQRGAWHMHCVVVMPFETHNFPLNEIRNGCYKNVSKELRDLWKYLRRILPRYGFGRFRLVPIWSNSKAAARYFSKYVMKSFADPEQAGYRVRRWNLWGPIRCATCGFAFVSSKARHKIAWMAELFGFSRYDEFKEKMGRRWAYYLFRLLDREVWGEAENAVRVVGWLLERRGKRVARDIVNLIELGTAPDLSELRLIWPFIQNVLNTMPVRQEPYTPPKAEAMACKSYC